MSRPGAQDWRRTWPDGRSRFTVEHDVDRPGFAATLSRATVEEIFEFIRGGQ